MSMPKVLVIGSNSFSGSHFVAEALAAGAVVVPPAAVEAAAGVGAFATGDAVGGGALAFDAGAAPNVGKGADATLGDAAFAA